MINDVQFLFCFPLFLSVFIRFSDWRLVFGVSDLIWFCVADKVIFHLYVGFGSFDILCSVLCQQPDWNIFQSSFIC